MSLAEGDRLGPYEIGRAWLGRDGLGLQGPRPEAPAHGHHQGPGEAGRGSLFGLSLPEAARLDLLRQTLAGRMIGRLTVSGC